MPEHGPFAALQSAKVRVRHSDWVSSWIAFAAQHAGSTSPRARTRNPIDCMRRCMGPLIVVGAAGRVTGSRPGTGRGVGSRKAPLKGFQWSRRTTRNARRRDSGQKFIRFPGARDRLAPALSGSGDRADPRPPRGPTTTANRVDDDCVAVGLLCLQRRGSETGLPRASPHPRPMSWEPGPSAPGSGFVFAPAPAFVRFSDAQPDTGEP